ncbi:CRISPR-associated endonuclease Cas1 [Nitrincola tibetensis]|uniref:CRISPR-associated endonuclease Cas1 n=1 Tax=Nitrincola tibetensis TaxID=2219697 RepID=A0A364NKU9_9GAMM|nr:CRISPR-associated endonuclease Cas1 [Nitrincola tibetensis]RAU17620.1 CRISPR-associated endonuclease Cas1 [Nitrincola tibetensis]
MESLFIDRKDTTMDVQSSRLIIRIQGQPRPTSFPLNQLKFIVVSSYINLSSRVLLAFDKAGITLVLINPRQNGSWLICNGNRHGHVERRLLQYKAQLDEVHRVEMAKQLVSYKILTQYRALLRHGRRRKDLRYTIKTALSQLRERKRSLQSVYSLESIRGIEGAAASAYFNALTQIAPTEFGFKKRQRRPPKDPINALLSLTYTLAHSEAVRAIIGYGFDPTLGFLHDISYGRESLACDVMEVLRADIDSWVMKLLLEGYLKKSHFQYPDEERCILNKEGRAIFYPLYQSQSYRWRKRCRHLVKLGLHLSKLKINAPLDAINNDEHITQDHTDETEIIDF